MQPVRHWNTDTVLSSASIYATVSIAAEMPCADLKAVISGTVLSSALVHVTTTIAGEMPCTDLSAVAVSMVLSSASAYVEIPVAAEMLGADRGMLVQCYHQRPYT